MLASMTPGTPLETRARLRGPLDWVNYLGLTAGGLGLSPVMPGTVGTLGAVALAFAIHAATLGFVDAGTSPRVLALVFLAVGGLLLLWGLGTSDFIDRAFAAKDPGAVVLDEVVGFLFTLAVWGLLADKAPSPWAYVLGFALFRVFDITKLWPASRLEAVPRAPGIMLDDVAAGIWAGAVLYFALQLFE